MKNRFVSAEFPGIQTAVEKQLKEDMERIVRQEKYIRDQLMAVDQSLRRLVIFSFKKNPFSRFMELQYKFLKLHEVFLKSNEKFQYIYAFKMLIENFSPFRI